MATTRVTGRGQKSPVDEEFLKQLYQGGELLAQGRVGEARQLLERAHQLQPRNEKGRNLLGLAYFKLGLFDRAAEIYEALVRDNPVDATLRVNLGLVYLKTNALQRAMREFEAATDLQPDHKKAHNYLGLALAQAGEYGRAREHFIQAGSDVMAEKMAKAIAGEKFPQPARTSFTPRAPAATPPPSEGQWGAQFGLDESPASAGSPAAAESAAPDDELRFAEDEGPGAMTEAPPDAMAGLSAEDGQEAEGSPGADGAALAETSSTEPANEQLPQSLEDATPELPSKVSAFRPGTQVPVLAELAPAVALAGANSLQPLRVGTHSFSAYVEGELLTRLEGLVAFSGQLQFQPEMKRYRGRPTDEFFGEGDAQLVRASGVGVLFVESAPSRSFLAVDLGDEGAYVREEYVFAFEEAVAFDNGKVPSEVAPDLDLVHLRGHGRVVLSLSGALRSVAVADERPVTVPLTHLVGWQGRVNPRVVLLPGESLPEEREPPPRVAVELSGEGFALISLPVR